LIWQLDSSQCPSTARLDYYCERGEVQDQHHGSPQGGAPVTRVTIETVAAEAGVSVTTVSHVFSGHRPVGKKTRERVQDVAQRLGYRPNAVAQSLRTRRTDTVMLIIPDITNPFYPAFARGAQDVLRERGYHSLLCNTDADELEERTFLEEAVARRVDGVIFMGFRVPPGDLVPFAEAGLSIVSLGTAPEIGEVDCVSFDDRRSAREATSYLLDRTAGTVGFIDGTAGTPVARSRLDGFREAHTTRGLELPDELIVATDFTRAGGAEGMTALLRLDTPPKAVFCANDLIAIGALDVLTEHGIRIPAGMAVMGCDDIDVAAMVTPALTTVRHPAAKLGRVSAELLLSRMTGDYSGPGRRVVIPHTLVIRDSA
jgi:LacI family transcriptional regulator